MTAPTRGSALTSSQEERLARQHIDLDHVWWWRPSPGTDDHGIRAWRGISLIGLPSWNPGDWADWEDGLLPDRPCETLYAIGHNLPVDQLLAAVAAHASWGHDKPQQLRELGPGDLVEGWGEFLRHRQAGCGDNACLYEDSVYVLDAAPSDYRVVPVTRITHPEIHVVAAAA